MNNIPILGRTALAIGFVGGALLLPMNAREARAGFWITSYETSGNCSGLDPDCYLEHGEQYYDYGDHPWRSFSTNIDHHVTAEGSFDQQYVPLECKIIGDVTVVFNWVGDNSQDLPPTKLAVKEILELSPTQAGPFGANAVSTHNTSVKGDSGKGLAYIDNSGRNSVIRLPIRHLSTIDSAPYQIDGTELESILKYSAAPDTRFVQLSRGGRYERKVLENGEWNTYGDSIYSARNPTSNIPGKDKFIPLNINADRPGNWSNNLYFNWVNAGFDPTPTQNIDGIHGGCKFGTPTVFADPIIGDYIYSGSPTGAQQFDTSYTATDNVDGATGTAYYHLTLHDPAEKVMADEISHPTIQAPMKDGGVVVGYPWNANPLPPEVEVGESTEYGYSLSTTTTIDLIKGFLGFELTGKYESKETLSTTHKATLPVIPQGMYEYLIAFHPFLRRHARFYKYDQLGKIKRTITVDASGGTYDPPAEIYHEAFEDSAEKSFFQWSPPLPYAGLDTNSLAHDTLPPLPYDFPSGGNS